MRLLSSNIKPYIPSAFDEKKDKQSNLKDSSEILKIYEESKKEGYNSGFKEGFEKGFEKGYEEGFKKASEDILIEQKKLKSKISDLDKIIHHLVSFKEEQIKSFLPEILGLSIKIAKKIVSTELSINKKILLNIIKEALEEISVAEKIIIKINPEDFATIKEEIDQITGENSSIKIIPTNEISQGSCYIETEDNIIDSKVEEKFRELENAIHSVLYSKD